MNDDERTFDAFASTVLRVRDGSDWLQLTPSPHRSGPALAEPFWVLSAVPSHEVRDDGSVEEHLGEYDPAFVTRRHLDLGEDLSGRGLRVSPAVGAAPDLSYGEQSYAVWGLGRDAAVAIAHRFAQLAIFEVDDRHITVVACPGGELRRSYAYELVQLPSRPCVMAGGFDSRSFEPCRPGAPADDVTSHDGDSSWMADWRHRYGLLGCDVCRGVLRSDGA
jgi:hypothetical protein